MYVHLASYRSSAIIFNKLKVKVKLALGKATKAQRDS